MKRSTFSLPKLLTPDPPPTAHVIHVPPLPRKDDDVRDVAKAAATKWLTVPAITLVYKTALQFDTLADNFAVELHDRKTAGASRHPLTDQIDQVDDLIEEGIPYVKLYIAGKYGPSHATAYYASFGIEHVGDEWIFPIDHDKRKGALQLMIDAVLAEGFGANTYGTAFWTQRQTDFNALFTQANLTDGLISTKVSSKNQMKRDILTVLRSLAYVLHGNYPDTYRAVWRDWGLQKEDY